ncbi:hypothetical protein [Pigmentiphaga daeguensis]|uniref:Uncharacterized protein n=1 Tax=Pigmentiphaga daeguensis TaxID=414049 RepID=A0ABN1D8F5_9BURK
MSYTAVINFARRAKSAADSSDPNEALSNLAQAIEALARQLDGDMADVKSKIQHVEYTIKR